MSSSAVGLSSSSTIKSSKKSWTLYPQIISPTFFAGLVAVSRVWIHLYWLWTLDYVQTVLGYIMRGQSVKACPKIAFPNTPAAVLQKWYLLVLWTTFIVPKNNPCLTLSPDYIWHYHLNKEQYRPSHRDEGRRYQHTYPLDFSGASTDFSSWFHPYYTHCNKNASQHIF